MVRLVCRFIDHSQSIASQAHRHLLRPAARWLCGRGGIGRRAALRSLWGNPWKFESSRPHQRDLATQFGGVRRRLWTAHLPPIVKEWGARSGSLKGLAPFTFTGRLLQRLGSFRGYFPQLKRATNAFLSLMIGLPHKLRLPAKVRSVAQQLMRDPGAASAKFAVTLLKTVENPLLVWTTPARHRSVPWWSSSQTQPTGAVHGQDSTDIH